MRSANADSASSAETRGAGVASPADERQSEASDSIASTCRW
jgi:hypothetical protein